MLGPGKKDGEMGGLGERETMTTRKTTLGFTILMEVDINPV
jgi:hypothetical protein